MAERAASLVDAVLQWGLVRRWVLTLLYRLRYHLAWTLRVRRAQATFARCANSLHTSAVVVRTVPGL